MIDVAIETALWCVVCGVAGYALLLAIGFVVGILQWRSRDRRVRQAVQASRGKQKSWMN